jgi:predicted nucleic acid-binding protein
MRVVDTSAWIEWIVDSSTGSKLKSEFPKRENWLVPTMVQLELSKWLTREMGEAITDQIIAFTETCIVVDLDTTTALAAADLCARHKLSTADAIIYATALVHNADLLTCDGHFEGLPGVVYVGKIIL